VCPSRHSTSAQGLTLVHVSAQLMGPDYDTQREEAVEPRMEEGEQRQTAGWEAASGIGGGGSVMCFRVKRRSQVDLKTGRV
jgi:hypothetical protein